MPFRVFALAFDPATGTFDEDELNRFCLGKRLLSHQADTKWRLKRGQCWNRILTPSDPPLHQVERGSLTTKLASPAPIVIGRQLASLVVRRM
jgi:hypothetical protein